LLAALKAGEFEAINELVFETMKKEYDQHKAAIDRLVALTNLRNEDRATAAARTVTLGLTTMVSTGTVLLIIAASIIWMVATGINRSLGRTVAVLDAMAGGDTSRRLEVRGTDEIAQLSHAVNRTVDNMNGVITAVTAKAESLAGKGRDLDAASRSLISDAERTVGEVRGAATAADQVSANTGNAATNTDELRQAITKIAESVNNLSGMVETGNQRANAARDIITKLDASSREVGQVVKLISRIAEQTNTLALNATIQAAAAGEAGRGFLVVANEVKDLAKKTADATTQVSGSIVRIQKDTADAVGAIGEVAGTINEITAFQQSVAAAITEQSATTDVLAGTVQDVAEQAAAIAGTVRQVNAVAEQTGQAAAAVGRTAAEITIIAGELATISEAKVTT
jgi:methyl-accepting chemotaxis protein